MADITHRQHIGANIKLLRNYRRMSQHALAEKIDSTQPQIARWEAGQDNISIDTIAALATALNCAIDIKFTPMAQG